MRRAEGQDGPEYQAPAQPAPDEQADPAASPRVVPPADGGLTTQQIAEATAEPVADRGDAGPAADRGGAGPAADTSGTDGQGQRAQLLATGELQGILNRWKEIQAGFVDEPRKAVQDADRLVADLMQGLARMFASEREQLEARWSAGDSVSTEDLRLSLRRYRSFFERLLAA